MPAELLSLVPERELWAANLSSACFVIMNIDALSLAEHQLLSRVERVTGLMEEKHEQLQQSGVYEEYGKIYEAYIELLGSDSEGLEALKRATFLMWYEQAEPSCFSGVSGLPEKANRKILEALERRTEAGNLDFELKWMLPYYNMIADWVFSRYAVLPHMQSFLAQADSGLWERAGVKAEDFINRGQMGEYWLSIIKSNATRFGKGAS